MTEQRKRGRPKKDPNAPKSNYYYSFAVKARKQSQKRLRDAKKRAAKATKQAEDKRYYAKKLEEKITKVFIFSFSFKWKNKIKVITNAI